MYHGEIKIIKRDENTIYGAQDVSSQGIFSTDYNLLF